MVEINGFTWTLLVVVYAALRTFDKDLRLPFLDRRIRAIEKRHGVPGMGAAEIQVLIWDAWDWDVDGGEKWTESAEWKDSVAREVLRPRVPVGSDVLEIGPGAGRWTETLVELARSLTLVDISSRCIEICRERFGHLDHVAFYVTSGSDLSFIADEQTDVVWSFDVFVHLAVADIEAYLAEFARVLRPGGQAIIHHAASGGVQGGWRSAMTTEEFAQLAMRSGFMVVEQFDSWGDLGEFVLSTHQDMISVIRKPASDRDHGRM
jgi:ubiquinone/menaquinone biosynthesis C-methylase UbiE